MGDPGEIQTQIQRDQKIPGRYRKISDGRSGMGDGYCEVRGDRGRSSRNTGSRRDTKILARKIGTSGKNTTKCGMVDPYKEINRKYGKNRRERPRGDRGTFVGEIRRSVGDTRNSGWKRDRSDLQGHVGELGQIPRKIQRK
jgi:hypothetical protein